MQNARDAAVPEEPCAELLETRFEERDGRRWVTGKCSNCLSRVAIPAPTSSGGGTRAVCPEGHVLRVDRLQSDTSAPQPLPVRSDTRPDPRGEAPGLAAFTAVQPADPDRDDPRAAEPQPNASTWGESPYNGPPEEGQPRAGSRSESAPPSGRRVDRADPKRQEPES
jgi:hypothetical protein